MEAFLEKIIAAFLSLYRVGTYDRYPFSLVIKNKNKITGGSSARAKVRIESVTFTSIQHTHDFITIDYIRSRAYRQCTLGRRNFTVAAAIHFRKFDNLSTKLDTYFSKP